MNIFWLEDEPETIDVIQYQLRELGHSVLVSESFNSFSDDLEEIEDCKENIIIIDIRMIFNREMNFQCFHREISIRNSLDSGFEYFNNCLRERFSYVKIIFFSSKPRIEAIKDAKKHRIDESWIISKESTTDLIDLIKEIS